LEKRRSICLFYIMGAKEMPLSPYKEGGEVKVTIILAV